MVSETAIALFDSEAKCPYFFEQRAFMRKNPDIPTHIEWEIDPNKNPFATVEVKGIFSSALRISD